MLFILLVVDEDVMMSGLVPFSLCPFLQGPCVGPLRPEANFLRRTSSTWRTGTNTSIGPGSRQPKNIPIRWRCKHEEENASKHKGGQWAVRGGNAVALTVGYHEVLYKSQYWLHKKGWMVFRLKSPPPTMAFYHAWPAVDT